MSAVRVRWLLAFAGALAVAGAIAAFAWKPEKRVARPHPRVAAPAAPRDPRALHVVAPGIAIAELERAYDFDRFAKIVVVRLELTAVSLGLRALEEHRFRPLFDASEIDVAVNAGFFEPDFTPSGLMIESAHVLSPANARGGSGVLVIRGGAARLVPYDSVADDSTIGQADLALQCGPRLIEADGTLGIAREASQRAARTAVCIRDRGRTIDLVVAHRKDGAGGPGLFTLATWLRDGILPGESGCESALNLDGGPSTAITVRGSDTARRLPPGPVVWALTATSRAHR